MPGMSSAPTRRNLVIRRGRTFSLFVRWGMEPFKTVRIAAISNAASVRFTTQTPHGLVGGWPVAVVDAQGMDEMNARGNPPTISDCFAATIIDPSVVEWNGKSSAGFGEHEPNTGYLQWYTPKSLVGCIARMTIKDRIGGTALLLLRSDGVTPALVLDDNLKEVKGRLDAAITEPLTWTQGVYDLEIEEPDGTVTAVAEGNVTAIQEVTT